MITQDDYALKKLERLELLSGCCFVLLDEEEAVAYESGDVAPLHTRRSGSRSTAGNPVLGWCLMALGFLVASGAGLILLGCLLVVAVGEVESQEVPALLVGGTLFGLLPLSLGVLLFYLGIRKLPKKRRRRRAGP